MSGSHMSSAAGLYQSVINDVITSVRESFLDESVDENVLLELKNLWVQKLEASKAIEQPQLQNDAAALDSKMAGARGGYGRMPPGGTQHVVISDPNRLVPVQITIPAQQGNPASQPRALTVQVPAHALQQGGSSGSTLQQVLTQAITQMLVVGLVSGGKDSCYNLVQCVAAGHDVVCLANLKPDKESQEEDSNMYQTVGWDCIEMLAKAMRLPLYVESIKGDGKEVGKDYLPTEGDEVEDLYRLLSRVSKEMGVMGVAVGAILSDYQRVRVESVCLRLGLTPLVYLWQRDQSELLREMVMMGMKSVLVKVACLGLNEKHLGKTLGEVEEELGRLAKKWGVNVCGEGGEYETFTMNCPLFRHQLIAESQTIVTHSEDAFAPVCLLVQKLILAEKDRVFAESSHVELVRKALADNDIGNLHPLDYCAPYNNAHNTADLPNVEVTRVDLREVAQRYIEDGDGWFQVLNISGGGTDDSCVKDAFLTLEKVLQNHELSLKQVVKVMMYVDSMQSYGAMNAQYSQFFGLNPPVRVCVGVGVDKLPVGCKLVISVVGIREGEKKVLHVQGWSHWAPANIGPYSQAVAVNKSIFISGMIGLVPGNMLMIGDGEGAQAGLALRHVQRVARAMGGGEMVVSKVNCYVLDVEGAKQAEHVWRTNCEDQENVIKVNFLVVNELPRMAKVEWEVVLKM